jgi:predicted AlkP superfamily pyrophosphatase or phosphodiesterase
MTRLALLIAIAACHPAPAPNTRVREHVVVVSIDGMMPDAYLDPDAHGLALPTLRSLVAGGAAGRMRPVMPSVTYPAHTTMVTGVPPRVHGIVSNKPLDPLAKNLDGWRWYAEDVATPTIYQAVEQAHGTAALVTWPVSVGAHASIVVPEYWRAGGPDDQKLLRALSTPGVLDDVARADPTLWTYLVPPDIKDHAQFAIARRVWATRRPDLMLVHAFALDDAQHDHGPWSAEAKATLEAVDRELGALLADLERSPEWSHTRLLVVSDHGFAPVDHELRLGALFVAHGLVHVDAEGASTDAAVATIASGGTALVYVLDAGKRAEVDAALAELGDHVVRRIDHDELVALGGDPHATFAIVAAPGNQFSDKRVGAVIATTSPKGTHGWPPDEPAMAASIIAFGPEVPHVALGSVDMTAIAPTLARWLGVALPTAPAAPIAALL